MSADYFVHDTAIVDDGCRIGKATKIWHFSHLMAEAIIGENCVLGQNVFIANKVVVGNNVKIQNNVSLYEGIHCEDNVFIGPSAVFTNVVNPRSAVVRRNQFKTTILREGVTVGANATIVCGIEIGKYAFVGAGSVVTKNIPAYALVMGNPSKQTGWMSEAGCKLNFIEGKALCGESGKLYQLENNVVLKIES